MIYDEKAEESIRKSFVRLSKGYRESKFKGLCGFMTRACLRFYS